MWTKTGGWLELGWVTRLDLIATRCQLTAIEFDFMKPGERKAVLAGSVLIGAIADPYLGDVN